MSMIVEISECRWVFTAGGNYLDMAEMGITLSILYFSHQSGGLYADEAHWTRLRGKFWCMCTLKKVSAGSYPNMCLLKSIVNPIMALRAMASYAFLQRDEKRPFCFYTTIGPIFRGFPAKYWNS